MTRKTKELFARICYGVPKQKRGHIPTAFNKGLAVYCSCSCGAKAPRQRYGNIAGYGYAIAGAYFWYMQHTGQEKPL